MSALSYTTMILMFASQNTIPLLKAFDVFLTTFYTRADFTHFNLQF